MAKKETDYKRLWRNAQRQVIILEGELFITKAALDRAKKMLKGTAKI